MKVTFGGSKSMTLMNNPYEPVKVESILTIEKEVPEGTNISDFEALQEKINIMLEKDLENKMKEVSLKQKELRRKLKSMLK